MNMGKAPCKIQTDDKDLSNRFFILLLKLASRERRFGKQAWTAGYKAALEDMFGEDEVKRAYPQAVDRIEAEYTKIVPIRPDLQDKPS